MFVIPSFITRPRVLLLRLVLFSISKKLRMVSSRPEARKRNHCQGSRRRSIKREKERKWLLWSLDPFSSNAPTPICARSLSLSFSVLLRSVRALSLRLCHVPFSLLPVLDWFENSASFSHRALFFFFPFFLPFSPFGGKVTPPKFDESKCARLARLDYYTRREAALCQAH